MMAVIIPGLGAPHSRHLSSLPLTEFILTPMYRALSRQKLAGLEKEGKPPRKLLYSKKGREAAKGCMWC